MTATVIPFPRRQSAPRQAERPETVPAADASDDPRMHLAHLLAQMTVLFERVLAQIPRQSPPA